MLTGKIYGCAQGIKLLRWCVDVKESNNYILFSLPLFIFIPVPFTKSELT